MKIINEILSDYSDYCHQRLIEEFGKYNTADYDPIYLYQRYKCRIIDIKARQICEASDLIIPKEHQAAYDVIVTDISKGHELMKYQSRSLKNLDYDDDMLSHWAIQHFHLGNNIERDGFVSRTKSLLFIHFSQEEAHIIGVFNHSSWCYLDIIEKIHRNWPQELAVFKSGSDARPLTETEYKILRKKHANTNVRVKDGTEYLCPGMGVTANGSPIFSVINSDKVIFMFNQAFESIQENIRLILESDPEKRESKNITIGMDMYHEQNAIVYKIKETDFKFTLQS